MPREITILFQEKKKIEPEPGGRNCESRSRFNFYLEIFLKKLFSVLNLITISYKSYLFMYDLKNKSYLFMYDLKMEFLILNDC